MDPVISPTLVAAAAKAAQRISTSGVTGNAVLGLYSLIRETLADQETSGRLEKARKEYEDTVSDRSSPVEKQRRKLLANLTELQTEVMLTVSGPTLLVRMLSLLFDQTVELYEARTEEDLKFVELSLSQIRGALERYKRMMRHRSWARWLAIIVTIIALAGLGTMIFFATQPEGPNVSDVLPVIEIPLPVLVWSAVGSFTAMLYRFNKSGDIELQDPLRWLFTRPITGVVMGLVAYFVLKVGFLSVHPNSASEFNSSEVIWLLAFIAGFSDRFADSILRTLVGRFGGDQNDDLVSLQGAGTLFGISSSLESLTKSLPYIENITRQRRQKRENEESDPREEVSEARGNGDSVEYDEPPSERNASDPLGQLSKDTDNDLVTEATNEEER